MADQTFPNFHTSRTSAGALLDADGVTIVRSGTSYKSTMSAIATYMATAMAALTPQFTAIELGHATDTTISRVSAGRIAVEGSNVLMASDIGTTVQAYDADLASWAAVTRASGFDTFAATPSSANLRSLLTDESGTGALLFAGGALGAATATSINGLTITTTTGTLTVTNGKTLSVSNTLTLTATDGSTLAIGAGGTLGSAALKNTGTSGNTVPLLDGANTWSSTQTLASPSFSGTITGSPTASGAWTFGGTTSFSNASGHIYRIMNCNTAYDASDIYTVLGASKWLVGLGGTTGSNDYVWYSYTAGIVVRIYNATGGMTLGAPTGGDKGTGTLNAVGVYDDNTLLTDLVLDLAVAGSFDRDRYANHPIANLVQPWWFDPDQYAEFWKANRYLPGMISWTDEARRPSTGEVATRLTGVVETHAVLLANDNDRIKELQARVAELEAKLAA